MSLAFFYATKRGLSAKKARGRALGQPEHFTNESRAMVQRNAQRTLPNKQAHRLATLLRRDGRTLAAIAPELNGHGHRTRRGKEYVSLCGNFTINFCFPCSHCATSFVPLP